MFAIGLQIEFTATHHLNQSDIPTELKSHSHRYRVEASVAGPALNKQGFLFDYRILERALRALVERYRGRSLNDFNEFGDIDPTLERFAEVLCLGLRDTLPEQALSVASRIEVRLSEDVTAWVLYARDI